MAYFYTAYDVLTRLTNDKIMLLRYL